MAVTPSSLQTMTWEMKSNTCPEVPGQFIHINKEVSMKDRLERIQGELAAERYEHRLLQQRHAEMSNAFTAFFCGVVIAAIFVFAHMHGVI